MIGFSLIEVLIALIVLSIGLIGTAALTVISLQSVHSALYTSIASSIALDYEERLWIAVADETEGCPSEEDVLEELLSHWDSENDFLRLPPGFGVEISPEAYTVGRIRLIPIIITWAESRFVGSDEEEFAYTASVHCRN